MEDNTNQGIEYIPIMVNNTPYCIWDWELGKLNHDFLNSIDPYYYEHIAQTHGALLDSDEQHYAATALRVAYSQGLETLFALLCAVAQSPHCVAGWLHLYKNQDLTDVVRHITTYKQIPSCLGSKNITWKSLSAEIHKGVHEDNRESIEKAYANLWSRFAQDFLNEDFNSEYNSIKHGLRVHMGGSTVSIGVESAPGVPDPPEKMIQIGRSKFGTTFYKKQKIGNNSNFRLLRHSLNWSPLKYTKTLVLISMSIGNILTALKASFGEDISKLSFRVPLDVNAFNEPWEAENHIGITSHGINSVIGKEHITDFTSAQIKTYYEQYCRGETSSE